MAFIQDPRLRQTWNQLSHTTEAVTSDAAAGIWAFGHRYVNPCLASLAGAVDSCAAVCLGDREERARRARERDRGARCSRRPLGAASRPEYSFDFYDDWEEDLFFAEQLAQEDNDDGLLDGGAGGGSGSGRRGGGILGGDWDRLLAGTGSGTHRSRLGGGVGRGTADVVEQPRRKRGMSYGTRGGVRRKVSGEEDPNVIPRTAPLGFLGRLPFKIVGSLRYKPSAANLREHPGGGVTGHGHHQDAGRGDEHEPLLGRSNEETPTMRQQAKRPRSDTTNSGDTSSSYRSRGDLFPSDGEGDEDAVPLDDEFTVALERVDDRGSTKTRSSKGKRPADRDKDRDRDRDKDRGLSRTVSRTTISSIITQDETKWDSNPVSPVREMDGTPRVPSLEDLRREEEQAERAEYEEIERRRRAASQLAMQRGLSTNDTYVPETSDGTDEHAQDAEHQRTSNQQPSPAMRGSSVDENELEEVEEVKLPSATATSEPLPPQTNKANGELRAESTFVPARLPHFG
ncbi:hypothetical protein C7999DRAFT_12019 [Corynascus novoguineensis]|uniref:Uncharacterized protein n=1 Tax=Corynascus novoguineensis TaxID=1126955 RepID=A0AAN7CXM1_9PEZI|nr:hypothetical protein C7999DRAFT_12019 [Corynascus novoguineensis]